MKGNLYLPILVVVYLIAIPFVARFVLHPASYREQHQVVDRVKQETSDGDKSIFGIHMFRCIKKASVCLDPCSHHLFFTRVQKRIKLV